MKPKRLDKAFSPDIFWSGRVLGCIDQHVTQFCLGVAGIMNHAGAQSTSALTLVLYRVCQKITFDNFIFSDEEICVLWKGVMALSVSERSEEYIGVGIPLSTQSASRHL